MARPAVEGRQHSVMNGGFRRAKRAPFYSPEFPVRMHALQVFSVNPPDNPTFMLKSSILHTLRLSA